MSYSYGAANLNIISVFPKLAIREPSNWQVFHYEFVQICAKRRTS